MGDCGIADGPSAVLVPVKAFAVAKVRLAPVLAGAERARLARTMAARVLDAALPLPRYVACDDDDVAAWATAIGADVIWTPGLGLNGAVTRGVEVLAARGFAEVVVAHADLPAATALPRLLGFGGVTLVPDRRDDGTNVACVPSRAGFTFGYGQGSFARHREETLRLGLDLRVARVPDLQWDVDTPQDLALTAPA
ncbi:MAG: 2-phospho-L-lactate guanylyltransferase [Actinomycetota bacterium]|nr:2-phospho-L-lactate guanylyltransferase [Actinomycetota bacterium]